MGVKYLWSIIKKAGVKEAPKNKRLAIDTSIWLYHYKNVPNEIFIYNTIKRILELLYNKNRPIFVFDSATPYQKKKAVEDRKAKQVINLAKKYVKNVICKICNISYQQCEHANVENQDGIDKDNELIATKIKRERDKNWGITYDEELRILDDYKFDKMTKLQKLNVLVKLRQKRKLPSRLDVNDGLEFSIGQINNLRKRNRVNELIDQLEKREDRRIMSDCSKSYKLDTTQKEKKDESEDFDIEKIFESDNLEFKVSEEINDANVSDEKSFIEEDFFSSSSENDINNEQDYESDILVIKNDSDSVYEQNKIVKEEINIMDQIDERKINRISLSDVGKKSIEIEKFKEKVCSNERIKQVKNAGELQKEFVINKNYIKNGFSESSSKSYAQNNNYKSRPENLIKNINHEGKIKCISIRENDLSDGIKSISNTIKDIFNAFNINYIDAPMEADSQCAYLNAEGLVDGVITEDNDIFLFGGLVVYKNYFKRNLDIIKYKIDNVNEIITRYDMIKLAYYLGCDYCEGQIGIGPKKAMEILHQDLDDNEYQMLLELYLHSEVQRMKNIEWKLIDFQKGINYIQNTNLCYERKKELLHYIDKLKHV